MDPPWKGHPKFEQRVPSLVGGPWGSRRGIVFASPAFASKLGYVPEDLVGKDCQTLTHEQDRNVVADSHDRLRRGEVVEYRKRYRHKDGRTWLLFEFEVHPVAVGTDVLGVAIAREIATGDLGNLVKVLGRRAGPRDSVEVEIAVVNEPSTTFYLPAPVVEILSTRAESNGRALEHEIYEAIVVGIGKERRGNG